MLEWNTKHFPLNLQSSLTLSNFRDAGVGFELRNQIRHCKTVCIKSTLYLVNYNRIRTQWTTKGNRDVGSFCLCGRSLHRYLRNFGGFEHPNPPRYATVCYVQYQDMIFCYRCSNTCCRLPFSLVRQEISSCLLFRLTWFVLIKENLFLNYYFLFRCNIIRSEKRALHNSAKSITRLVIWRNNFVSCHLFR